MGIWFAMGFISFILVCIKVIPKVDFSYGNIIEVVLEFLFLILIAIIFTVLGGISLVLVIISDKEDRIWIRDNY